MPHFFHTGEFYSLLVAFVWACGVILFRQSGQKVPPVPLNLFKSTMALVLLVPTLLVFGVPFLPAGVTWTDWALLLASGVLGIAVADSLFFASLNRLGVAGNAVVDCLYSPAVVLCAVLALGEPLTPVLAVALGLMVVAVALGTGVARRRAPTNDTDVDAEQRHARRVGVTYGVLGIVLLAIGVTMAKPVLGKVSVVWATAVRIGGATVFLAVQGQLPTHRAVVRRIFTPSREWRLLLPAAFVGTYLSTIIWLAGMKHTHASIAGVLNQTSTIFLPILAWIFLREPITRRVSVAIGLGFMGAALLALLPPHLGESLQSGILAAWPH